MPLMKRFHDNEDYMRLLQNVAAEHAPHVQLDTPTHLPRREDG